ncbi:exosome complex component RRP4 [Coccinella septempunctata]|uniref:exosome complex component RRP4 n=1 Tax=Coccinella septempunctata TaxID=41139 RepID=UPI001D07E633|nr:exosome complex component RRP4 [Coccinella septempunctata]
MPRQIQIRSASNRVDTSVAVDREESHPAIYTPGQIITQQNGFMRGHGTYEEDGVLKASVAGVQEKVNNLISVRPLKSRYNGEIGDVVVGRITEVQQKRWKVNTNARLDSVLLLSGVNLPGGELRRRSAEDEHMMRKYLQEGDLISAEVQSIFSDGSLSLHTRSLKYGKLAQGFLVKVSPSLIRRSKTHFLKLQIGINLILGTNGFIWIYPFSNDSDESVGGFILNSEEVIPENVRIIMTRVRQCILALAQSKIMLYDTSILFAYEESMKYSISQLIIPEAMVDIALLTQHRLILAENE